MKFKVLHITTVDFTLRKMLLDKLIELRKFGYEIDTMSDSKDFMSDENSTTYQIMKAGFKYYPMEISRKISVLQDMKSIFKIYRFLKNNPYHIVHTHTAKAGFVGRIAARLAGVPVVVHTSHGLPFYKGQSNYKNIIYKLFEKLASFFSDGYFSQNKEDLYAIEKFTPKFVTIGYEGNGVALDRIDNMKQLSDDDKEKLKRELGIESDCFVFLMAARFESVKNHKMLIESISLLHETLAFKVILAGEGPLYEEIIQLCKERGVSNKVIFLGYRSDIFDLIQISDAVILTSEKEGIPRIIMEAMALSKPVLATNVLGTRELVSDKITGELVELNEFKRLASKINQWVSAKGSDLLINYGEQARKKIEQEFTEAKVAERIHFFYKELLQEKGQYQKLPREATNEEGT